MPTASAAAGPRAALPRAPWTRSGVLFCAGWALLPLAYCRGFGNTYSEPKLVLLMSIALLFLMPWLDQGKVKSIRYRGLGYKLALALFAVSFIMLGAVGAGVSAETIPKWFGADADVTLLDNLFGRFWTLVYFGFFLFIWVYTHFGMEKTRPVPERVTTHD